MSWKKVGKSGNQYEEGERFTAISKPVYQEKYLVTVGDRTKPKSIKRYWVNTQKKS